MIDTSASMDSKVSGSSERKLDFAKTKLLATLKDLRFDSIELFTFDATHHKVGDFENVQEAMERFPNATQGSSMIWDSIDNLLDIIEERKRSVLICVTDGDDTGSKNSCRDVVQKSTTSEIHLKIIDLDGNLKQETPASDATEENILELADIKNLTADLIRLKERVDAERGSGRMSCPVIPLAHLRDDYLKAVITGMRKAVPYLEKLMQVRYYPVPTLIVDEKVIDHFGLTTSPPPKNPQILDLVEIYRFLAAVCLSLHFEAIDFKGRPDNHPFWNEDFLSCDSNKVRKLWQVAEDVGGLWPYLCWHMSKKDQGNKLQRYRICIPEIFVSSDPLTCCEGNLYELLGILKKIQKTHHFKRLMLEDRAFESEMRVYSFGEIKISELGDRPELQIWKKYLTPASFRTLQSCIDSEGLWDKNLRKIVTAFEIAIPLAVKFARAITTPSIARRLHLCGLYLAPSDTNSQAMECIQQTLGFPPYFSFMNTGLVMICPERIEKMLRESEINVAQNSSEQLEKLIRAVVVHEHAHAASLEGISLRPDSQYCPCKKGCGKDYEAVSEGLAEWSELDFSRTDEDIYEIIIQHASRVDFPNGHIQGLFSLRNDSKKKVTTGFIENS